MSAPGAHLLEDGLVDALMREAFGALARFDQLDSTARNLAMGIVVLAKDRIDRMELADHVAAEVRQTMVRKCPEPEALCRQ